MKKFYVMMAMLSMLSPAKADNMLQIMPTQIEKGATYVNGYSFDIDMVNDVDVMVMQFELYLPDGVKLDEDGLVMTDRADYVTDRRGNKSYYQSLLYKENETEIDGVTRSYYQVVISANIVNNEIKPFLDNEGPLITAYYITDENLPETLMPVEIRNIKMGDQENQIRIDASSTFFYTPDYDFATTKSLDLSDLTGYMPADVVAATNALIADNDQITEVNIQNLDNIGAAINSKCVNCMYYLKAESEALTVMADVANVVAVSEQSSCSTLKIADGAPYANSVAATVANAEYSRVCDSDEWQGLFVPYALSYADWSDLGEVAELDGAVDTNDGIKLMWTTVKSGDLLPNHPYIFKPTEAGAMTIKTSGTNLADTSVCESVTLTTGNGVSVTLKGVYSVTSGLDTDTDYVLSGNVLVPVTDAETSVNPFRVYLTADWGATTSGKTIEMEIDGSATSSLNDLNVVNATADKYYDLNGRQTNRPSAGIYVIGNKKVLVK